MKGYGQAMMKLLKDFGLGATAAKLGLRFPEMASSMKALFPIFDVEYVIRRIIWKYGTLTGVTGNTAEVSTQLKAVFSNLIKPTTAMQKLIKKYGYANSQAMLEAEGFVGVLEILQKETGGSSDKMGELFSSTEALTAILALTGEQYDTFVSKVLK
ncbi:MAG: phage tail tape measure protein [Turicibacter sanguinis]